MQIKAFFWFLNRGYCVSHTQNITRNIPYDHNQDNRQRFWLCACQLTGQSHCFNTFYLHFLQLKNVDFDGLFGNINSVIDLSQRLFDTLQETDSIGKKPVFKKTHVSWRNVFTHSPIRRLLSACCTLHFMHMSTINCHLIWVRFWMRFEWGHKLKADNVK